MRRANRGGNKNYVPSAAERRKLKMWMLAEFGDGISAPCSLCGRVLLFSTMTRDLFPVPARRGGRYKRGNIRPLCLSCNASDGARQAAIERTEAKAKHEMRLARRRHLYALRKQPAQGVGVESDDIGQQVIDPLPSRLREPQLKVVA